MLNNNKQMLDFHPSAYLSFPIGVTDCCLGNTRSSVLSLEARQDRFHSADRSSKCGWQGICSSSRYAVDEIYSATDERQTRRKVSKHWRVRVIHFRGLISLVGDFADESYWDRSGTNNFGPLPMMRNRSMFTGSNSSKVDISKFTRPCSKVKRVCLKRKPQRISLGL